MKRRTMTAALCAALLLTAVTTGAAVASGLTRSGRRGEAAALTGTAELYRSAGDDITFSFDAHLAAVDNDDPLKATGTFEFSHYLNGEGARAKAEVDCLLTGGDVAVVSGVITDLDLPGCEGRAGRRHSPRPRPPRPPRLQLGRDGQLLEGASRGCVSSAPFEKVRKGNRRLRGSCPGSRGCSAGGGGRSSAVSRYGTRTGRTRPCPSPWRPPRTPRRSRGCLARCRGRRPRSGWPGRCPRCAPGDGRRPARSPAGSRRRPARPGPGPPPAAAAPTARASAEPVSKAANPVVVRRSAAPASRLPAVAPAQITSSSQGTVSCATPVSRASSGVYSSSAPHTAVTAGTRSSARAWTGRCGPPRVRRAGSRTIGRRRWRACGCSGKRVATTAPARQTSTLAAPTAS